MKYVPNPKFKRELDREPGVKRELADRADDAEVVARSIGLSLGGTGAYASSIASPGGRLLTTDPAGHLIEWGSVNNPPYAPLRRAVQATGAHYVDEIVRDA